MTLVTGDSLEQAENKVQIDLNSVNDSTKQWNVKLREQISTRINFINIDNRRIVLYINYVRVPFVNNAKYLDINLDVRLKWKKYIKENRKN